MLNSDQLKSFEDNGYLIVPDALDKSRVLDPLVEEYHGIMDRLMSDWVAEGLVDEPDPDTSFEDLVTSAYRAGLDYFQPMDISLPAGDIQSDTPFHAGPAAFNLLTAGSLLDAVESIIGPEITSNPIQHVRIKPPSVELDADEIRAHITATDWHQDRAVTLEEADETRMVTSWIAITDATVDNGCLQVIPGSHRGMMMPHCPNPQVGIPHTMIDQQIAKPLPVKAGSAILFHPLTIHGSLTNHTPGIRWSFDVRYSVTGDPTGRPMFPEFVARSRRDPSSELRDPREWHRMWEEARDRLSTDETVTIHRWAPDAAHCA